MIKIANPVNSIKSMKLKFLNLISPSAYGIIMPSILFAMGFIALIFTIIASGGASASVVADTGVGAGVSASADADYSAVSQGNSSVKNIMIEKFMANSIQQQTPYIMADLQDKQNKYKDKYKTEDAENIIILSLKDGDVLIRLFPDVAPKHASRIKQLANQGFYDNIVFHRVIDGFMAQTGDPTGTGTGGSGKNLKAEFNDKPHKRGVVSMARANHPDSADSQFFIVLADSFFLDGQYTVFGEVIEGMEFVDNIKKGNSNNNGAIEGKPDKIIKMHGLMHDF